MAATTVVTGVSSGIGRATAMHLAQQGHHVIGTVRSQSAASAFENEGMSRGLSVKAVLLDVTQDESVHEGFARIHDLAGAVDNLVNNAGVAGNAVVEECTAETLMQAVDINAAGSVRCVQQVLPQMRDRGSGSIAFISSAIGRVAAVAQAPYVASKWALEGLAEELAQEVAQFGIRVRIIQPGVTKSAIFAKNASAPVEGGPYQSAYNRMFSFYSEGLRAPTDAEVVANTVSEALSDRSDRLWFPVGWGSRDLMVGRERISDEEWVELGRLSDAAYVRRFEDVFGVKLAV